MDEKMLNQEVDQTLKSLDGVECCRPSGGFAERVTRSLRTSEETPSWLPNLALAMVVLLFLLDGVAMTVSWQSRPTEMSRQQLIQMTRSSLWVETPGLFEGQR